MAPLDWLDLSTARNDISQVKEGFGVISDEKPRFGVDLRKRIAILLKRNRNLKKDRDFHFKRCKRYKLQLDQLQKKYDEIQNYFAASQLLKKLDESHKEISRLNEIISIREQNSQVDEPFVNGEFTDLQAADVSIEEHEEEQIVKVEPQESEVEEDEEVHQHPFNKSAEYEVNSAEFEKRVEILDVRSANRELRIRLCRVPQEMCLQNGKSSHSESNLVCKWIHKRKGVCRQEFHDSSELKSHLKTIHLVAAKRTRYRCRWQECPSYGHPFVVPGKFISHLHEHLPELSNETHINQIIQNLSRGCRGRGLKARLDKESRKGHFGSLGRSRVALRTSEKEFNCTFQGCGKSFYSMNDLKDHMYPHLCGKSLAYRTQLKFHDRTHKGHMPFACSYNGCDHKFARKQSLQNHLDWHKGERPFKCPYDTCHWAFAKKAVLYNHIKTHTGERPFECTFKGCERSFAHKNSLDIHLRIHNDERPFECTFDGCPMRFRCKSNLTTHLRVHTKKQRPQAKRRKRNMGDESRDCNSNETTTLEELLNTKTSCAQTFEMSQ